MLSYALKRITRSWKLFAALLLGMTLATTFFGGINVAADTLGKQFVDQQLATSPIDFTLTPTYPYSPSGSTIETLKSKVALLDGVSHVEAQGSISPVYVKNYTRLPSQVKALEDTSLARFHLGLSAQLGPREAVAFAQSQYSIGDKLDYTIPAGSKFYNLTLQIVGIIHPDNLALGFIGLSSYGLVRGGVSGSIPYYPSVIIASWERAYTPILDWASGHNFGPLSGVDTTVDVFLDRNRLISPWDLSASANSVSQISDRIANLALQYNFERNDLVTNQLQGLSQGIFFLRVPFIIFSIPVMFIAWYVGRTVSQASFNLRRKEIGLLMTKGFSKTQLYRHFVTEAIIVGLISGAAGLGLAFVLNPFFVSILNGSYTGGVFLTSATIVTTLIFALFLTLLAIRSPASQASNMDPAQALREYVYLEDVRASKKRGALIAFSLGLYKIILLILGVNFVTL
ncbi:MAG TPA: ABC transporter permease, partial [Candidatus Binatus sp.]|nr:ABC transporter permease [Candidatus Binatus sp.]